MLKKKSSLKSRRFFSPNLGDLKKKRSLLKLRRFWCPNLDDLQKKVFSQVFNLVFHIRSLTNSHRQYQGEAIFVLRAKVGLKSTKNEVFCILFRPIWGSYSPPPLVTQLTVTVQYLQITEVQKLPTKMIAIRNSVINKFACHNRAKRTRSNFK